MTKGKGMMRCVLLVIAVLSLLLASACGHKERADSYIDMSANSITWTSGSIAVGDYWAWSQLNRDGTTVPCTQVNNRGAMICAGSCYRVVALGDQVGVQEIPCPPEEAKP